MAIDRIMYYYLILPLALLTPLYTLAQPVRTYIPKGAYTYRSTILKEQDTYFPKLPISAYTFSLIEQESCIHLTHKKCFNPESQLKTSREEGAGLGQLTRAYNKDGTLRFDSLQGIRLQYKQELKDLSWSNIYQRPDLQIRAMTLMVRDTYNNLQEIKDPKVRLQFTDAAYNGGLRDVRKERIACGLKAHCNPQLWFGHVEHITVKSTVPIYGTRTAHFINREHVENVFHVRLDKYTKFLSSTPTH